MDGEREREKESVCLKTENLIVKFHMCISAPRGLSVLLCEVAYMCVCVVVRMCVCVYE